MVAQKHMSLRRRSEELGKLIGYAKENHFNPSLVSGWEGQLIGVDSEIQAEKEKRKAFKLGMGL